MELDDYQARARETARSDDMEVFTLGLFGEAGSVATTIKKIKRDNEAEEVVKQEIAVELGDVLWYLAAIASELGLSLSEIAQNNLDKVAFLFSGTDTFFDEKAPEEEKLPRLGKFTFVDEDGKVTIIFEARDFGDPLDDNAHDPDGYRFHDVFHFAYMTVLGWSPVIRGLLKRKRKYDKAIDRVEDGARARFLEEGLSVFIFNQNQRTEAGVSSFADRLNIPFSIITVAKTITKNLEVRARDATAWRDAIAQGFAMFDKLVAHGGGTVICDMVSKTLMFEPPK